MASKRKADNNAHVQAFHFHERFSELDALISELEVKWTSERKEATSN